MLSFVFYSYLCFTSINFGDEHDIFVTFNSLYKSDDIAVKSTYKNLDFVSNYTIEVHNLPRNYDVNQMKSRLWSYFNTVSDR